MPHALYSDAARLLRTVLLDDGDYLSSETPAQKKKSSRTREKLWQAIQQVPQVTDDEMPDATPEQARVRTRGPNRLPSHVARHAKPRATLADRRCGELACRDGPASKLVLVSSKRRVRC